MVRFEWNKTKSETNFQEHGISFEEAKSVFYDTHARLIADRDDSETEDRFIMLGVSSNLRTLVVCHCYRGSDEVIRIISARKATKQETRIYREHLG